MSDKNTLEYDPAEELMQFLIDHQAQQPHMASKLGRIWQRWLAKKPSQGP